MRATFALLIALLASPAALADTALILSNARYEAMLDLREGAAFPGLEQDLQAAGFNVIVVENGRTLAMQAGVEALLNANEQDRVAIFVSGHFARSQGRSWVMGVEARRPNVATIDRTGISLDILMDLAARAPGQAVVALGVEPRRAVLGDGILQGLSDLTPPQGVTVLTGSTDRLAGFAADILLTPGADLPIAIADARGIGGRGFLSSAVPFIPEASAPVVDLPEPDAQELALWDAAEQINTAGSYRAYLREYPEGAFAAEATARIDALDVDVEAAARATEEALNLSRQDRAAIQRGLTILGYDPRGIDGIFGRGSRSAIREWQVSNDFLVTGFLSTEQINLLGEQATARAAELEEQARLEREARDRADRAYWQALGRGGTEDALRAYLDRYPDGLFSQIANQRLSAIEEARRAAAEGQERANWDAVRAADTVAAYQQYLDAYPNGLFRAEAEARIAELQTGIALTPEQRAQAEAREAALNLQPVMRVMVERRLVDLGLDPGAPDGNFDARSRDAIGQYQAGRGLNATGYLDQRTVVRLLAEALGGRIIE